MPCQIFLDKMEIHRQKYVLLCIDRVHFISRWYWI